MKIRYIFTSLILALLVAGCTSNNKTVETLEKMGFTEVKPKGYDMFSCSEDDFTSTKFEAKNPLGQTVEGTVCCGMIFKNCTVRW